MALHDFLASSRELLELLESLERRHEAMSTDLARLDALPAGEAMRSLILASLRKEQQAADVDLDRAIHLLEYL